VYIYQVLYWQHCRQCGAYVKIDNDCTHDYNITLYNLYCKLAAKGQIAVMLSPNFLSMGAKVPWSESSWTFRSTGASVPGNESSTGTKVASVDFSLPGTKVQSNEKSRYQWNYQ